MIWETKQNEYVTSVSYHTCFLVRLTLFDLTGKHHIRCACHHLLMNIKYPHEGVRFSRSVATSRRSIKGD
jgi:hypothetical protein